MDDLAVNLDAVTKRFGAHVAVRDLSLQVPRGSIYGFIGPNGSGKTTTIRMILHIILPTEGRVEVLGTTATRAANDRIGYLPEERGLYRKMTLENQLTYMARLKGVPGRQARATISEWLERLGLAEWRKRKIEALSKGMSQKVQFISAIIARPELLILDEPFSGLDPVNAETMRNAILEMRGRGTTIIFSTHDMKTAEQLCDRIFMIYRGDKVLDASLGEIQRRYGSDTIRLRLGEEDRGFNVAGLDGVASVRNLGQSLEVRTAGDPQALLRALVPKVSIQHFEIVHPSLQDIFVRIAQPTREEVATLGVDFEAGQNGGPKGEQPGASTPLANAEVPRG